MDGTHLLAEAPHLERQIPSRSLDFEELPLLLSLPAQQGPLKLTSAHRPFAPKGLSWNECKVAVGLRRWAQSGADSGHRRHRLRDFRFRPNAVQPSASLSLEVASAQTGTTDFADARRIAMEAVVPSGWLLLRNPCGYSGYRRFPTVAENPELHHGCIGRSCIERDPMLA